MPVELKVHVEKALDGREVHFEIWIKNPTSRVPKFCTYCGSDKLSEGRIGAFDGNSIHCQNCGAHIHDCCSQPDYSDFKDFMKENKKR